MRPITPALVATVACGLTAVSARLVSGDTLTVSGLVVRADTRQRYGGAPLGIYPVPVGAALPRITTGTSGENGLYTLSQGNVFLSSVWVVYEGDLYAADPVRVDLTRKGTARIGQAQDLRLRPKPTPEVARVEDAATYLSAELKTAEVLVRTGYRTRLQAQAELAKAARTAAASVPPERAAEVHALFTRDLGPPGAAPRPIDPPSRQEFLDIAAAVPSYERRPDARSEVARNCEDCKEGEAKAETTLTIPNGLYVDINDPPCYDAEQYGPTMPGAVKDHVAKAYYSGGRYFALHLPGGGLEGVPRVDGAGDLQRILRTVAGQPQAASCVRLVVAFPKSATVTRIEKSLHCPAGGWCGWATEPTTETLDDNLSAVSVVAKNWSHDTNASGTLEVFYRR